METNPNMFTEDLKFLITKHKEEIEELINFIKKDKNNL